MLNVLRFHNAVEQLARVRAAGYTDATMRGLRVRLPNPISSEDRNHLLHTTRVAVAAKAAPRRIQNASADTPASIARELAEEAVAERFGAKLDGLKKSLLALIDGYGGWTNAQQKNAASTLIETELEKTRQQLIDVLAPKFLSRATKILSDRSQSELAPVEPPRTPVARLKANLAAFDVLKKVVQNRHVLTAKERMIVAHYTGWGGLDQFLQPNPSMQQFAELKYQASQTYYKGQQLPTSGPLLVSMTQPKWEYFTPVDLAQSIVQTISPLLDTAKNAVGELVALEPSAGIGRLVEPLVADVKWTLVESNPQQATILSALYPASRLYQGDFAFEEFCANHAAEVEGSYNLIMANPPYADRTALSKQVDPFEKRRIKRLEDYFLRRCLRLLARQGVAVFIVPRHFLDGTDQVNVEQRREVLDHWHLAAAARLPSDVFRVATPIDVLIFVGRGGKINTPKEDEYIVEGRYFEEHPEHIFGTVVEVNHRPIVNSAPGIRIEDMAKRIKLRPIEHLYSHNQASPEPLPPSAPAESGRTRTPRRPTATSKPATPSSGLDREQTEGPSFENDFVGSLQRIVLTPDQRHMARACMLAEHIPAVRRLGMSGNFDDWTTGRTGYEELRRSFDAIVLWLAEKGERIRDLKGLSDAGVEGAKAFIEQVWERPERQMQPYPNAPSQTGAGAYLAVSCRRQYPRGEWVSVIQNGLGIEDADALIEELCTHGWILHPVIEAQPYGNLDGLHFQLTPVEVFVTGDLGERYRQAVFAKHTVDQVAAARAQLAALGFDEDLIEKDEYPDEVPQNVEDQCRQIKRVVQSWGKWLKFSEKYNLAYETITQVIGFDDVEGLIPFIDLDAIYIAPTTLGDAVFSYIQSVTGDSSTDANRTYDYSDLCVYQVAVWSMRTGDLVFTPWRPEWTPQRAYAWFSRFSRTNMNISTRDFEDAELEKGVAIFRKMKASAFGEGTNFEQRLGNLNVGNATDLDKALKFNSGVWVAWKNGFYPKGQLRAGTEGYRWMRPLYNALIVLSGNPKKKLLADEGSAARSNTGSDNPAYRVRHEAITKALLGVPSLHDGVREWMLTKFIDLQLTLVDLLKDYDEVMQDESLEPEARAERANALHGQMQYCKTRYHLPTYFIPEKGYENLRYLDTDGDDLESLHVIPFQSQFNLEELEDCRAIADLDGLWLVINQIGTPILGPASTEFLTLIEAALTGCEYCAVRFMPSKLEATLLEQMLRGALQDRLALPDEQELFRHRLRSLCAPFIRPANPKTLPWLMRWLPRFDANGVSLGGIDPLPHQIAGAWQTFNDDGALMAYDVGVGKTYTGTATALLHRQYGQLDKLMMILPNPLTVKWCRDFAKCAPDYSVALLVETLIAVRDSAGQIQLQTQRSTVEERNEKMRDWKRGLYDVLIVPRATMASLTPTLKSHWAFAQRIRSENDQIVTKLLGSPLMRNNQRVAVSSAAALAAACLYGIQARELCDTLGEQVDILRPNVDDQGNVVFSAQQNAQYQSVVQACWDEFLKQGGKARRGRSGKSSRVRGDIEVIPIDESEDDQDATVTIEPEEEPVEDAGIWDKIDLTHEDFAADLVIIDEAQMFKNLWFPISYAQKVKFLGSAQTSAQACSLDALLSVTRIDKKCKVQLLSATPAKNSPIELYTMLKYINSDWLTGRGVSDVVGFARRFLRIGKTLYVKNSGELERDAEAIVSFSDVAALQAILFRYATFLDAEQAAQMMPEGQRHTAKPKAVGINVDVVLSQEERKEVAALRGLIAELGTQRQIGNANAPNPNGVAQKEKSSLMLALGVLPKVGAQRDFSYVVRPYSTRSYCYNPGTWREETLLEVSNHEGVVSIEELYKLDHCNYPTPEQERDIRAQTVSFWNDPSTQITLSEAQTQIAERRRAEASENAEAGNLPETALSAADAIYGEVLKVFTRLVATRPELVMMSGQEHMVLPPRWWWFAATVEEREFMARQLVRQQFKFQAYMTNGLKPTPPSYYRRRISPIEEIAKGVFANEQANPYDVTWKTNSKGEVVAAGAPESWYNTSATMDQKQTGYQPFRGSSSILDKFIGAAVINDKKYATEMWDAIQLLDKRENPEFLYCRMVLWNPAQDPIISRKRESKIKEWWTATSIAVSRIKEASPDLYAQDEVTKARRKAANTYYPTSLPKMNLGVLKTAFATQFAAAEFAATGEYPPNQDLWKTFSTFRPSQRIEKLVSMVQQDKYAGKAQIIFCMEKDTQLAIYWALVRSGRDPMRIGVMNADTTSTAADKLRFANMLNGVEGQPSTARLDIIIANSVAYEGIDLQVRTIAIHHFDLPWEPATVTQRNGRAWRQGNTNPQVDILYYTARDSSDSYRMQMLLGKGGWITDLVKSEAFAIANPSADPETAREQQITTLCPDRKAAELVMKRLEEIRLREQRFAKIAATNRLLGRTARLSVEIANVDFTDGRNAPSLRKQYEREIGEVQGALAEGFVEDVRLAKALVSGMTVATIPCRRGTRIRQLALRVGDQIAVVKQDGPQAYEATPRLILRFLSTSVHHIDDVLLLTDDGRLLGSLPRTLPWDNVTDLVSGSLFNASGGDSVLTDMLQYMQNHGEDYFSDLSPREKKNLIRVADINSREPVKENVPFPRFAGWEKLFQALTKTLKMVLPDDLQDYYFTRDTPTGSSQRDMNFVLDRISVLGADFAVANMCWDRIQHCLFAGVIAQASLSAPDGVRELLTLALSGIGRTQIRKYAALQLESREKAAQSELSDEDTNAKLSPTEKWLASLAPETRELFTQDVQSAFSTLLEYGGRAYRQLLCKRYATYYKKAGVKYNWWGSQLSLSSEDQRIVDDFNRQMDNNASVDAMASDVIGVLVGLMREELLSIYALSDGLSRMRSGDAPDGNMRHELPVIYSPEGSEPVIAIWYPNFQHRDTHYAGRTFNQIQLRHVNANTTIGDLRQTYTMLPVDAWADQEELRKRITIIPPDAAGWALFRTAKHLGNATLSRFGTNYFTPYSARASSSDTFYGMIRSVSVKPTAFSP
jgi:hypothetical protein